LPPNCSLSISLCVLGNREAVISGRTRLIRAALIARTPEIAEIISNENKIISSQLNVFVFKLSASSYNYKETFNTIILFKSRVRYQSSNDD